MSSSSSSPRLDDDVISSSSIGDPVGVSLPSREGHFRREIKKTIIIGYTNNVHSHKHKSGTFSTKTSKAREHVHVDREGHQPCTLYLGYLGHPQRWRSLTF